MRGTLLGAETLSMPCISTAHLTEAEANTPRGHHDYPVLTYVGEYGLIVYCGQPSSDWVEAHPEFPNLAKLIDWSRGLGYEWLRFDSDADAVDGLEAFEW